VDRAPPGQSLRAAWPNPDVSVLLLEAGGSDEVPSVTEAARWHENLGSERDWKFVDQPNPHLKGRSITLEMGKVLGGGSSINVMGWARGHKNDWDFFASESGDPAWNYESVLEIYRQMEDWQGAPSSGVGQNFQDHFGVGSVWEYEATARSSQQWS
jgi:choline dehydrogenase